MNPDALLDLLRRFQAEDVAYVLVGGHASFCSCQSLSIK
jgi:hypothetical protein